MNATKRRYVGKVVIKKLRQTDQFVPENDRKRQKEKKYVTVLKIFLFCKILVNALTEKNNMLNLLFRKIMRKQYLKQLQSNQILNC